MGLFFPEDPHFDENQRQTGFYRYRQLLSTRFGRWWKINLLTLTGFAPLAAGIFTRWPPAAFWRCSPAPFWAA